MGMESTFYQPSGIDVLEKEETLPRELVEEGEGVFFGNGGVLKGDAEDVEAEDAGESEGKGGCACAGGVVEELWGVG